MYRKARPVHLWTSGLQNAWQLSGKQYIMNELENEIILLYGKSLQGSKVVRQIYKEL